MERLDSILKSVATSSTLVSVASASNYIVPKTEIVEEAKVRQPSGEDVEVRPRPSGGRRPTLPGQHKPPEEDRKVQRRERNKQAAARCRKRRLDLTCSLQVIFSLNLLIFFSSNDYFVQDEVDQWEDKVKSLKEELSQLETQKKGLEAILRKHSGTCKIVKSGMFQINIIKDYHLFNFRS